MGGFACVEDYEVRYGEVEDAARMETLLDDASAFIAAQPGFRLLGPGEPGGDLQQLNLVRVTCSVVHRSLSAGDLAGLSSVSQGAGGYTASVGVYNPSGDFYLTKGEKQALGISGARIGSVAPAIDGWYGSNAGDAQ